MNEKQRAALEIIHAWERDDKDVRRSMPPSATAQAFLYLRRPIPESLCQACADEMQQYAPPGWIAIAEPYLNRMRIGYVQEQYQAINASRQPGDHD